MAPATTPCLYCAGIGELEATDIFCGAGGSSLGLEWVCCPYCGRQLVKVTQALNHWDLAVEAHNENFPGADHDVHDVEVIPARRFRRTPLLWASPECTHHTYCRGHKDDSPEAARSRATFSDIVRFTAYHRYDAVIVENVIEARLWCDEPGHGEKCDCGGTFDAWLEAMCAEGYEGQVVYFNSQFALPTPQSRDRMYVVFWREGVQRPNLDFRPVSWCSSCEAVVRGVQAWKPASRGSARERIPHWGRYGANYVYRCPNEGCGQPVAPAVVGARESIDFSLPIERIADKPARRCRKCKGHHPVSCNTRRRIKVGWENIARKAPMAVQVGGNLYERDGYARVWSLAGPVKTLTQTGELALVTPERNGSVPASAEEPSPAVTTRSQLGMVLRAGGQAATPREADEPTNTITAHDRQVGLVLQNMENNAGRSPEQPAPPVTTGGNHMLVQVNRGSKGRDDGAHRTQTADEPHPAVTGHGELGLVEFRGEHGTLRSGDEPAHTVTAQGTHHGLLVYNGMPGWARELAAPSGVVTGRDHHALLMPYYRTGLARPLGEPAGTVTTRDREALVLTEEDIDDCYLRMLQWPELLRFQQMHEHPDGSPYQLTARRRDKRGRYVELSNELRTKMIGNAVSSPVATMLGYSLVEALRHS